MVLETDWNRIPCHTTWFPVCARPELSLSVGRKSNAQHVRLITIFFLFSSEDGEIRVRIFRVKHSFGTLKSLLNQPILYCPLLKEVLCIITVPETTQMATNVFFGMQFSLTAAVHFFGFDPKEITMRSLFKVPLGVAA